jgi:hypothetical protein
VVGAFIYSYQYRNNKIANQTSVTVTTVTEDETEATNDDDSSEGRILVAEDKENDYQVYFDGTNTDVVHGDYKRTFTTWAYSVKCEYPTIYCKDYDGDGEKELAIRIVNKSIDEEYVTDNANYTYTIYLLKPVTTDAGNKIFTVLIANEETWKTPFTDAINCELTQLKSCNKFLQFVMNDADVSIEYDDKTGITTNKYVGYALAQSSNNKTYYTLKRWTRGAGIYSFADDGTIVLDIQVFVEYNEISDVQYIGNIHCDMAIINEKFNISPNTIEFQAADNCLVSDPRETASSNWKCVINNESTNTNFKSTDIDWIEAELSLKNTADKNSQYFDSMPSKIKCVDSIEFSQDKVVLTAKSGYSFSKNIESSGKYSVIINSGTDNEMDISYSCSVNTTDGSSILTITFDKTYNKDDFDNVEIKFGI